MDADARIRYHLMELETARDPSSPGHVMPELGPDDRSVLDIGCGIGQTLAAGQNGAGRFLVGVDRDLHCLRFGRDRFPAIAFAGATAERLPFADGSFDRVICRVTLPYTDIPVALGEIARVLRPGGAAWLTLHPFGQQARALGRSLARRDAREAALRVFVLINGTFFHCTGRLLRLPGHGSRESFQTGTAMVRALRRAGLDSVSIRRTPRFVVTATKPLPRAADAAGARRGSGEAP